MKIGNSTLVFGFLLALFASSFADVHIGVPIIGSVILLLLFIPSIPALLVRILFGDFIVFGATSLWAYQYPPPGFGSEPILPLLAVSVSYPSSIGGFIDFGITFLVSVLIVKIIMDRF